MRKKGILLTVALLVALLYGANAQAWTPTEVLKNSAQNLEIAKVVLGMAEGGGIETLLSEANDACAAAQSTQDAGQRFFAGKVAFFNAAFAMKLALANPELRNAYQKEIGDSLWDSANILGFSQDDTIMASKKLDPIFSQAAEHMYDAIEETETDHRESPVMANVNSNFLSKRIYYESFTGARFGAWGTVGYFAGSLGDAKTLWEELGNNQYMLTATTFDKMSDSQITLRFLFTEDANAVILSRITLNGMEITGRERDTFATDLLSEPSHIDPHLLKKN